MNAETASAWAAWLAAAIAVGSVAVAVRATRHSKDSVAEARRSATAAELSAKEASRSADASIRSADAAERQAVAAEAMVPPPQPKVAWQVSKLGEGDYALRNVGTDTAGNVTVEADGYDPAGIQITPEPGRVLPGVSIRVFLAGGVEAPDVGEFRLRWDGQAEPVVVPLPR
jgi:hypothetical protein